ncbi:hypothetical protein BDW62DRAFT_56790 [Aspergillus aurantiobrunneus]
MQCPCLSADELKARLFFLRARFQTLRLKYDHYQPRDLRSGRVSIMKKLIDEHPSLELPDWLLTLERLSYMDQEDRLLENHAHEFRQLAYTIPSKYESLTVNWFARSLSDRVSRKIVKGILASLACTDIKCSLNDVIQIATAVDEADLGDLEAKETAEEPKSDVNVLMDVISVQKAAIETLTARLSDLRGSGPNAPADAREDPPVQKPDQSASETQPAPSCGTQ